MYPIKRLLVGFDLTETDDILVKYCAYLAHQLEIDKIYFLHIAQSLELPEEILEKYPDCIAPLDENIRHELMRMVNFHFTEKLKENTEVIVLEGHPERTFLREIKIKQIDLVVMGHKKGIENSGYLSKKLARLAHCSIALISEDLFEPADKLKKFLVPVDFSENSSFALKLSKDLASLNHNFDVTCQHVYSVPAGFSKTGKSYEEFAAIMLENAKNKMKAFLARNKSGINPNKIIYTISEERDIPKTIINYAENHQFEGIIIGSKGRTDTASFFLGSTSEKLVSHFKGSMIIVKDKKHNMDFMDVLLKI